MSLVALVANTLLSVFPFGLKRNGKGSEIVAIPKATPAHCTPKPSTDRNIELGEHTVRCRNAREKQQLLTVI